MPKDFLYFQQACRQPFRPAGQTDARACPSASWPWLSCQVFYGSLLKHWLLQVIISGLRSLGRGAVVLLLGSASLPAQNFASLGFHDHQGRCALQTAALAVTESSVQDSLCFPPLHRQHY